MPDLIRHPVPPFEGIKSTGFRLEFTSMKIGAGMTTFLETVNLQEDFYLTWRDRRSYKFVVDHNVHRH
jgi:hypothetical protein